MRVMYTKPKLKDLSQGSRIAFVRQFRLMTQDDVSDKLGLTGECKRRTITRYEKGDRNPKDDRTLEIAQILNVNINSIKKYEYKEPIDIIYTLMWLEELISNYNIDLSCVPNITNIIRKSTPNILLLDIIQAFLPIELQMCLQYDIKVFLLQFWKFYLQMFRYI